MDLKPSDFFIGVIDFFAVILPGAVVTYFLKGLLYARYFGEGNPFPSPQGEVQGAIVFVTVTYVIGNLLFVLGSLLLDKLVYDKLLRRFFEKNFDLSYHTATAIRDQYLSSELWISELVAQKRLKEKSIQAVYMASKREIINTFKWARHYLTVKDAEALVEIKKLEADSKFFRSLVVAFIIVGAVLLSQRHWTNGALCFALSLASLYRYGDLRYKSTETAYETIVTLEHLVKPAGLEPPTLARDTRKRFIAPAETVVPYERRIAAFTSGLRVSTELLAIPLNETWEVLNSSASETLFCLSGTGLLKTQTADHQEQTTVISNNAVLPVPAKSSFQILNSQPEPLLLLTVR